VLETTIDENVLNYLIRFIVVEPVIPLNLLEAWLS
jgi:hypothetical protein